MEASSKKEKVFQDLDNSVVISRTVEGEVEEDIRRINGNGKNAKK